MGVPHCATIRPDHFKFASYGPGKGVGFWPRVVLDNSNQRKELELNFSVPTTPFIQHPAHTN